MSCHFTNALLNRKQQKKGYLLKWYLLFVYKRCLQVIVLLNKCPALCDNKRNRLPSNETIFCDFFTCISSSCQNRWILMRKVFSHKIWHLRKLPTDGAGLQHEISNNKSPIFLNFLCSFFITVSYSFIFIAFFGVQKNWKAFFLG